MASLREEFEDRYGEFVSFYNWEEQDQVVRQLANVGEMLDLAFGPAEAAFAMTALEEIIKIGRREWSFSNLSDVQVDNDWRETWDKIEGFAHSSQPPFLDELHDLHAFGTLGIFPIWGLLGDHLNDPRASHLQARLDEIRDVKSFVRRVCGEIDRFIQLTPRKSDNNRNLSELIDTRDRALARLKLDYHEPLTTHELAVLSGVSLKRLQNAIYAKTDEAPRPGKGGVISPEDCMVWLQSRDYYPSIWKEIVALYPLEENWGEDVEFVANEGNNSEADFCFVPVANDGSEFTPELWRDARAKGEKGGFIIGAKGQEIVVADYDEALAALQKMEVPRWRRPNPESGNWGLVTGQSWRRVQRISLAGGQ